MKRKATCSCGALSVSRGVNRRKVSACPCLECQRRTGSAFGIAVFVASEMIEVAGTPAVFSRIGDRGKPVEFHFCPSYGSTFFWEPAFRPGMTAVALGSFDTKDGLEPTQTVYDHHGLSWVTLRICY